MTNTILDFSGSGLIEIGALSGDIANIAFSQSGSPDASANWTAGWTIGTTNITIASASGISVGNIVALDQLNDWLNVSSKASEGDADSCDCPQCGRSTASRSQLQFAKVTAINGNVLTIDPPLFMGTWTNTMDPECWYEPQDWVERVGVENLTIDGLHSSGGSVYSTMYLLYAGYECWLKNVKFLCLGAGHCHIATYIDLRCEFQGCDMIGEWGGALSYGFAPIGSTADFFHDNMISTLSGPISPGWCTHGVALVNNYIHNNYFATAPNWNAAAMTMHDAHGCGWLIEGNFMNTFLGDMIHGSGGHNTIYRNRLTGQNTNTDQITHCVSLHTTNRHYNIVGNVLGMTNYHDAVLNSNPDNSDANPKAIFWLGWVYPGDPAGCTPSFDPGVTNTVYIHMNYDVTTSTNNGVVWSPTNTDHTLPDSLVYASKPSSFGFLSWPAYDPANGSNTVRNNLAFTNIPAGYRFYYGTNPPAGPPDESPGASRVRATNLRVIGSIRGN